MQSDILESLASYFEESTNERDNSADSENEPTAELDASVKAAATASMMKQTGKIPQKLLRSQIHKKESGLIAVPPEASPVKPQTNEDAK